MSKTRSWKPVLTLFFLSPIVGELLSGSTPLPHFLNPLTLFFLTGLYGSGAIIVRELLKDGVKDGRRFFSWGLHMEYWRKA
jgi:hypothetical protein